jgi:serine/threonine-protein kinase
VPTASLEVAAGAVIGTDPSAGTGVAKGSSIDLLVSTGPAILPVPADIVGADEAAARSSIESSKFVIGDVTRQFNGDNAPGIVLAATKSDGSPFEGTYGEQQPVNLVVSAGPVPDVAGQTLEEAQATLSGVELVGVAGSEDFNDDYPAGQVYQAVATTDPIRPGDSITLNISRGPEPVTVPGDLVGKSWTEAKAQLTDLGFDLQYNAVADAFPDTFKVSATDPAGGASVPKGSTMTVSFSVF